MSPPPEKRPPRSWLGAWGPALIVCLVIFVASSLPASSLPKTLLFPGQDKVEHALVYGVLGFLVARARRLRGGPSWAVNTLFATAFTLLYGASDEFHQSFVPGRSVEGLDLLADVVGGLVGALVGGLSARWSRR